MGITNDERRRIAANLRESWKPRWHGEKMMHRLREALEIDRSASGYGKFRYYRTVAERLADLIEPGHEAPDIDAVRDIAIRMALVPERYGDRVSIDSQGVAKAGRMILRHLGYE